MNLEYKKLLHFPIFLAVLVAQLIFYALTEVETFLVVLLGIAVGLKCGYLLGVITFLSVYLIMRMVGGYVAHIAQRLGLIAQAIAHVTNETDDTSNQ